MTKELTVIENTAREAEETTSTTRREIATKVLLRIAEERKTLRKKARQASRLYQTQMDMLPRERVRRPHKLCVHGAHTEERARWEEELKEHCAQIFEDLVETEECRRGGSGNAERKETDRKKKR